MDELIRRFDCRKNDDLVITERGVAYQRDMSKRVDYGLDYFNKCLSYEDQEIAIKINEGRIKLVNKYVKGKVLDVGIGSGEFIKKRPETFGFDINPEALQWLAENGLYSDQFKDFKAFTFWDVIEHVESPNAYFSKMPKDSYVFISVPILRLRYIRESKHYRPGEHLYYFTRDGLTNWMAMYRFRLLEVQEFEREAGREDIVTFAFKKNLEGYHDLLAQYRTLHSESHYGDSGNLYLDYITPIVKELDPKRILDFGCGRCDLSAHYYKDGERDIQKYDPAIGPFKRMPKGKFDLVLCVDVMEHILIGDVKRIFNEIQQKSDKVIFVIHLKKARAILPNKQNAHVTILTDTEWARWVRDVFGVANRTKTEWDHVLMLSTW